MAVKTSVEYDFLVVGAGISGAVCARSLADNGKRVLVIEKRDHLAGNAYDRYDDKGILIHRYGPHIFHTQSERVYSFLTRFTTFDDYRHKVVANIRGTYVPVPFDLDSIHLCFEESVANGLEKLLTEQFGYGSKVTINELLNKSKESSDGGNDLEKLADFIYKNVFLCYTQKQWGLKPEEISPDVLARVPVMVSRGGGYFTDKYQGMPDKGYTEMIKAMLESPLITVLSSTPAQDVLELSQNGCVLVNGCDFDGKIVYTGALDELLDYRFGPLPYRTLDFVFESFDLDSYQPCATVNYTVSEDFTRISEFKKLTGQKCEGTTVVKEYPRSFDKDKGDLPYYPISSAENEALYRKYRAIVDSYGVIYPLGRLAEYRYYNMDAAAESALELADRLIQA